MESFEKRYPHELSGGQQQRIALARALAPKPNVLLMDEPFSNLDADLKESIREELGVILKKANMTCIMVTHDRNDVEAICDVDGNRFFDKEYRDLVFYLSYPCLLYTSPSPRDRQKSRMPSSA